MMPGPFEIRVVTEDAVTWTPVAPPFDCYGARAKAWRRLLAR